MAKRKSNKKQKKNKLLLLILLLSVSIIMLAVSTYAWFTSNTAVSVEQLEVNVSTVNGLQISADAVNWKAKVLKTDLEGANTGSVYAAKNYLPDTLDNVSSAGAATGGYLDIFHGVVSPNDDGTYGLVASKVDETHRTTGCNGDSECAVVPQNCASCTPVYFVAFDLFFKTDKATGVKIVAANSGVKPKVGETDTGIKNTTRVAFVKQGNVGLDGTSAQAQALQQGDLAAGNSNIIIWEPNYDVHTQAGVENALSNYNIVTTLSGGSVLAYKGVKAEIPSSAGVKINTTGSATTYFANVTPTITTTYGFTTDQHFDNLAAGVTKYRVYWWVEGQDVDTENGATGKQMTLNLSFAKAD